MYQIIDDALSECARDHLENYLLSPIFPWYFSPDVNWGYDSRRFSDRNIQVQKFASDFQMVHLFDQDTEMVLPYLRKGLDKAGYTIGEVYRLKANLLTPQCQINSNYYPHLPHVDGARPHHVVIYYVNESDGDTILYQERYSPGVLHTQANEEHRVTPKRGRILIFNGNRFHASSNPIFNPNRVVINLACELIQQRQSI